MTIDGNSNISKVVVWGKMRPDSFYSFLMVWEETYPYPLPKGKGKTT